MHASATKTITIQYVAMFKDQADRSMEKIETEIKTCAELYEYLQEKYKFTIPLSQVRVAVNHEFCSMTHLLKDQDLVVFIPPVCGG
jgi:molybdopterin synthase sulfur carrier subunit